VSVRARDNAQGKAAGKTSTQFTSVAMLWQIKRVVNFWLAYAG